MFTHISSFWVKPLTVVTLLGVSTLGFSASTYRVKAGDTLSSIAKQYGVSVQELQNINNLKSINDIKIGDIVLLNDSSAISYTGQKTTYTIQAGDTISSIVKKFDTTPAVLAELNPSLQSNYNQIVIGQKLIVPAKTVVNTTTTTNSSPKKAYTGKNFVYKVKSGDTFLGIANRFNISASDLAELNDTNVMTRVQIGQTLLIPETADSLKKLANEKATTTTQTTTTTVKPKTTTTTIKTGGKVDVINYEVQKGDSLGGLSQRYNVKLSALAEINGLSNTSQLKIGQKLVIPVIK
ncbi:LysM peptidoglycan-binding domain-containing protein [Faucicola boevrei]|uniref:LysM peptidoglycan-binding domain-containing protein n=1 Tax=Faucicola boevrei TaxID=346665 RepID=UPI00037DFE44|nr:LysM peptidoglycan-binding domain-containing protein [Moraxella boevrei]